MSMTEQVGNSNTMYLSIVGGKMVQKSSEGVEGAVKREYDFNGNKGVKWEIPHKNLTGYIAEVRIKSTEYGDQCQLVMEDGDEQVILTMGTSSQYFGGFARRLPNLDLANKVKLNTYDFEGTNGKQVKGINVVQDGEKITDYYFNIAKKEGINGIPTVKKTEAKSYTKAKWKYFFSTIEEFLIEEVKKVKVPSRIKELTKEEDEISVEDIPF